MPEVRPLRLLSFLLIVGCCLTPIELPAAPATYRSDPEYLINSWETEDGLPENSATAIAFGPDDFLWFGTWNGLVRFDGIEFTVLTPKNTPELPDAAIVNLHADRRRRLWVSTGSGLVVLEGTQWRRYGSAEGWVGNFARTFADRRDGEIVLTTFDGHILESTDGRLRKLPPPPGEPDQGYFGAIDEDDRLWVAQNQFVGYLDGQEWHSLRAVPPSIARAAVGCAPAREGGVWILLRQELIHARDGKEVRTVSLPSGLGGVWSFTEDSASRLWFASYDLGLSRLSLDGSLRRWNHTTGLKAQGMRTVVEDPEGNVWVGTSGGGLSRLRPRRAVEATQDTLLAERQTQSIALSSAGGLWIASSELGVFHRSSNRLDRIPFSSLRWAGLHGMAVHEDRVGRVWYGEKDGLWWRRPGGDFERIPTPWPSEVYVRSIFETSLGHVWLAGTQGAIRFDGERFRTFATEDGLPRSNGIAFGEDARQRLWAAVDTGLYRLESERFVEVRTPEATPFPEVLSFLAEPDGTLWLGTRGEGLWRRRESAVDKVGTAQGLPVSSVHAILDDGLGFLWMPSPHGIVRAARADLHAVADGRSSRLGSILLDRRDGLPSVECSFSQPSCARDPSGRLWFATQRGIAVVQPSTFRPNPIAPPVRILRVAYHTASRIDGDTASPAHGDQDARSSRVVIQNPTADRPLSIPPGSFGLEIAYAAPSFSAPEKVRFQTRLDGISRYWDDAGNQRLARFEQLPPGDYTFRVRAANQDGVGNEAGAALAFVVRPFFWQTPSFRGVLGLLLAATGAAAVWWRTRARRQSELAEMERLQREMIERKRTEETLARQRNELAHMSRVTMLGELSGSLAHELNQPLTSILSNAQAAQRFLAQDNPDLDELRAILADIVDEDQRAGEIIRRLRGLLKKGEEQHHELDPNLIVQDVLHLVRNDLLNQGVEARLELTPNPPAVLGDRVQLQQVLLNLILNACEAMSALPRSQRCFQVRTESSPDGSLHLSVSDQGPGIPDDRLDQVFTPFYTTKESGMGLGLSVCRTILAAHRGRLWASNRPEGGATFHLTLPPVDASP